jgi:hypothetical protein
MGFFGYNACVDTYSSFKTGTTRDNILIKSQTQLPQVAAQTASKFITVLEGTAVSSFSHFHQKSCVALLTCTSYTYLEI